MKNLFELQRMIILKQYMHLVFNENTFYQQNVTKFDRIQRLPNLKICLSVSMATEIKKN